MPLRRQVILSVRNRHAELTLRQPTNSAPLRIGHCRSLVLVESTMGPDDESYTRLTHSQFFALANQHMRSELNDLARRLDKQAPDVALLESLAVAPESSGSE